MLFLNKSIQLGKYLTDFLYKVNIFDDSSWDPEKTPTTSEAVEQRGVASIGPTELTASHRA